MISSEGLYTGDTSEASDAVDGRLRADTRLECKVCWHVYDPAQGDPAWQVPPGTSFLGLPEDWRCPTCDGAKSQFLPLDD